MALLENPIGTRAENHLSNGNRLLLISLTPVLRCDALTDPAAQLDELATRIEAQGYRPYVIPVGGSNARRVRLCGKRTGNQPAVRRRGGDLVSGRLRQRRTHAGLAVGLEQLMPQAELIGVTVSRSVADQLPKVVALQQAVANSLELQAKAEIILWMTTLPRDTVRQTKMDGRREAAGAAGRYFARPGLYRQSDGRAYRRHHAEAL